MWRRWRGAFDAVIAISETVRRRLAENGVTGVDVIRNGVAARPARPPLTSPPLVAYAGRLVPEKGPDVLLRAFVDAAGADARLLLAGEGPLREPLARLAADLGVADRVELPGRLPRTDLERRLDAAWVQAVPGRWEEPLGNVTLEGMMRGTAMLVTDVGGPAEVIDHERTGLVVRPGDVGALAGGLRRLLGDRSLADSLGRAARDVAVSEYDEARTMARYEAVYDRIVGTNDPTSDRPRPRE
jgi:glycosyltransferase involved in cell wall biosynthesis